MKTVDHFLEQLYKNSLQSHVHTYDDAWKTSLKSHLEKALGDFYSMKEATSQPIILEKVDMGSYERLRVEISTVGPLKMPIYVLLPKNIPQEKIPAVIAIHGHGYGSRSTVGLNPDGSIKSDIEYHKDFAVQLVNRGVVVAAPELIGFGDRRLKADLDVDQPNRNSCTMIASQLLLYGKTLAGLRVQECRSAIDYLHTLQEVDHLNIGCMGISGGGLVAGFTSAMDDRIKATVISGYTNTFKASIMDRLHCLDNYIPGILNYAEMPELIGLSVPRHIFIESGTQDDLFPVQQAKEAIDKLKEIYQSFGVENHVSSHIFDGGHEICGEQSLDWLTSVLQAKVE